MEPIYPTVIVRMDLGGGRDALVAMHPDAAAWLRRTPWMLLRYGREVAGKERGPEDPRRRERIAKFLATYDVPVELHPAFLPDYL